MLDREAGLVDGEAVRLQQVIWNLLSNAVKFTPKDGHIGVELKVAGEDLKVVVSDTGEGIDSEFLPFIFERFRQADSSAKRMHGGFGHRLRGCVGRIKSAQRRLRGPPIKTDRVECPGNGDR